MKLRLITKIAILTNCVLVLVMSLFAYLNLKNLESALLLEVTSGVDKISETIIRSSHHLMLEDDLPRVHQMINEVGQQKDIQVIRLINKKGRISFSTNDRELGLFLDKKAEACNMCHMDDGEPRTHTSRMNSSRLFTTQQGKHVVGLAKAIYNQESCYTAPCHYHPAQFKVLGILDVVVSLDPTIELLKEYRNKKIALTVVLVVVISICLYLLALTLINHPVRLLLAHTRLVASGDLGNEVSIASGDEIGELAGAFNDMTCNLRKARQELENWGKNLEAKVEERASEIKQMQDHLLRSEKLASLGELVAGIAHELNNPLTGMLVFSNLVHDDERLHPELQKDLVVIIQQTERCSKIVKGLLDFSRESCPQPVPTCLNSLIETTLALIGHQAFLHNVVIRPELDESLPETLIDPNQVEQVIINLMINASQAMPEGGIMTITTGVAPDGRHAFATIRDTGCGIPEENLGRIFDPFFSTKEKGTGLGLSLCYGIVENNRGRIEVESTVNVGTAFTVTFPLLGDGERWDASWPS